MTLPDVPPSVCYPSGRHWQPHRPKPGGQPSLDLRIHHRIGRSRGGRDTADNLELFHVNGHRQIHVRERPTKTAASREGRS